MEIERKKWSAFVLLFGGTEVLKNSKLIGEVRQAYPKARVQGCSTAGEIRPSAPHADCELHNQTMAITTFLEK